MRFGIPLAGSAIVAAALAACGGGGSSSPATPVVVAPATTPPVATQTTQQIVQMALPTTAIGVETDPTFGTVAGYSQQTYSQVLGFAPGTQIMIRNGETATPHTFSVIGTSGFTTNPALSTSAAGGSTVGTGFSSGTVTPGALAGPFTLASGTYYIGCAYHYASNGMRTVLVVAANAAPGPQATAAPSAGGTPTPTPQGPLY